MKLTLRIWRQSKQSARWLPKPSAGERLPQPLPTGGPRSTQRTTDQLRERPVSFEHDCREGICGSCGFLVNGQAHGPRAATSVCQLYLREFNDGAVLTLELARQGLPSDSGSDGGPLGL